MSFELVPALQQKEFICDLPFCRVLMEDNADCPWVFLVPRKEKVRNMLDLTTDERLILMREIEIVERAMNTLFKPTQTNVAMIGNKTPQLHVHVICRFENDPLWPETVWGQAARTYSADEKQLVIQKIKEEILRCQKLLS